MNSYLRILKISANFLRKNPKPFSLLLVFLVLEGGASLISVLAVIPLTDFLIDSSLKTSSKWSSAVVNLLRGIGLSPSFWVFGSLFAASAMVRSITELLVRLGVLKIKYAIGEQVVTDVLDSFFRSRWEFFSKVRQGEIIQALTKDFSKIGDTLGQLATLLANFIQLLIYIAIPIYLSYRITFTALFLCVVFGLPFFLLNSIGFLLGQKNTDSGNKIMSFMTEIIQSSKTIIGFGNQHRVTSDFKFLFKEHVGVTLKLQIFNASIQKLFAPMAIFAVIIAIGINFKKEIAVSELAAILWSLMSLLPVLSNILHLNISINNFLPSYEHLIDLQIKAENLAESKNGTEFKDFNHSIELKSVQFSYFERVNPTIKNINLKLPKNKMVALVGESGSGKSTIVDILLGLQKPEQGGVYIDGKALDFFELNSFRRKIAFVSQEPILFNNTLKENLLWTKPDATEFEMHCVLGLANILEFVKELPDGMDTIVGERGFKLSGGQKQRIALARALLRRPSLLILDEATSSLDTESELEIQNSLEKLREYTTLFIVAHRISTIRNSDLVYVLANGSISETGSYGSLMNDPRSYLKKIINLQNL